MMTNLEFLLAPMGVLAPNVRKCAKPGHLSPNQQVQHKFLAHISERGYKVYNLIFLVAQGCMQNFRTLGQTLLVEKKLDQRLGRGCSACGGCVLCQLSVTTLIRNI
jgi:hypothetical protein